MPSTGPLPCVLYRNLREEASVSKFKKGDMVVISVDDYDRPIHGAANDFYRQKNVKGKIVGSRHYIPKKGFINRHPTETTEYAVEVGDRIYWKAEDEIDKI